MVVGKINEMPYGNGTFLGNAPRTTRLRFHANHNLNFADKQEREIMEIKLDPARKLLILFVALLALAACNLFSTTEEPPGVGEKAERGYAVCDPIIASLEQYKAEKGAYPDLLTELVPDYLPEIPTEVNDQPINYTKSDESYSLSFYYIGPGMNTCTYTPEDKWKCSGAY